MSLEEIELLRVRLPLRRPFTTSFGTMAEKDCVLVRALGAGGAEGWGECVASTLPDYSGEWTGAAWLLLRDVLAPAALSGRVPGVRGNPMARAALEVALLDLDLRERGVPLRDHLGGVRTRVPCGVSLGIERSVEDLLEQVRGFTDAGYRRVKLKIRPGHDVEVVRAVREAFPDLPLSADANAAYRPEDAERLAQLDAFGLEYLEQPLAADRLVGHAELQARLRTPICLDETITSVAVAREAIGLGACRVVNIKIGRVGGLREAVAVHDAAAEAGVPVWCGGMLETGVGRAANVALATLPNFTLPGDTSGSDRYFEQDLTEPFVVDPDGTMAVPDGPGIGVAPLPERLSRAERLRIGEG